jgi:hypothetical protein
VRELYRSDYFILTLDEERKLVRRQRTALPYTTLAQLAHTYEAMIDVCKPWQRPEYVLLVDMRVARPRNDPAFEQIVGQYYERINAGFGKVAVLVSTEAGRLQVQRTIHSSVVGRLRAFCDEREALSYLAAPRDAPAPRGRPAR